MLDILLRPFAFLGIQHPDKTFRLMNWVLSFLLAALSTALILSVNGLNVFGETGLLAKVQNFVQSLPGFYLAALTAVAAFGSASMDELMPGTPPTGVILHNGAPTRTGLTRRRMLSMMFAFLTASSFLLTFGLIAAVSFASLAHAWLLGLRLTDAGCLVLFVKGLVVFIAMFALWQMLLITTWGLFYLGDRIHTPDK